MKCCTQGCVWRYITSIVCLSNPRLSVWHIKPIVFHQVKSSAADDKDKQTHNLLCYLYRIKWHTLGLWNCNYNWINCNPCCFLLLCRQKIWRRTCSTSSRCELRTWRAWVPARCLALRWSARNGPSLCQVQWVDLSSPLTRVFVSYPVKKTEKKNIYTKYSLYLYITSSVIPYSYSTLWWKHVQHVLKVFLRKSPNTSHRVSAGKPVLPPCLHPGAPHGLHVLEVRDTSLVVLWDAPTYDGRSPVNGFYLDIKEASAGEKGWKGVNEKAATKKFIKVRKCSWPLCLC